MAVRFIVYTDQPSGIPGQHIPLIVGCTCVHYKDVGLQTPLVSIITPSFNQAAYIRATIESVLSQDYPHLEYIILDGGSTDGTIDILESYHDPRLTWVSEPDNGQSDALNKGLRMAKGEILAYINSDDLLLPGAISVTMSVFERDPESDLVYGDCIYIDSDGATIGGVGHGAPFDLERVLGGRVFLPQQTVFWRRRLTEKVGYFDANLHYVMDVDYWLRMAAAGAKLTYEPGVRAAYRLHNDSKTISQVERFWKDWEKLRNKFFALPYLPEEIARLKTATEKTYWWLYMLRSPWGLGARKELRPLIKKVIVGPVPLSHRVIGLLMLIDTYLKTSTSNQIISLARNMRSRLVSN